MTRDIVLEARSLSKQVSSPDGPLTIVREVSFAVSPGESIAIVGRLRCRQIDAAGAAGRSGLAELPGRSGSRASR